MIFDLFQKNYDSEEDDVGAGQANKILTAEDTDLARRHERRIEEDIKMVHF